MGIYEKNSSFKSSISIKFRVVYKQLSSLIAQIKDPTWFYTRIHDEWAIIKWDFHIMITCLLHKRVSSWFIFIKKGVIKINLRYQRFNIWIRFKEELTISSVLDCNIVQLYRIKYLNSKYNHCGWLFICDIIYHYVSIFYKFIVIMWYKVLHY